MGIIYKLILDNSINLVLNDTLRINKYKDKKEIKTKEIEKMVVNNHLLEGANDNQKKAIEHIEGPCFVTAGPGSGKTFVVVRRTANMILNGVDPNNICLFTFTNKAATEMRERVVKFIGESANQITVGTYHSVCCRLLRKYAKHINYESSFTIMDTEETTKILKRLAKNYEIEAKDAYNYIADCKKKLLSPDTALVNADNDYKRRCANVYQRYEEELKRQNAMDFDNLIINTIKLLEHNPQIKQIINNTFKYIVADEYHDSSLSDLKLIELLAGKDENVCMILDPDQSIYGFRGANIDAVMQFRHNFKNTVNIFNLAENYRCSQTIVNASKKLISHNEVLLKEKFVTPAREFVGAPIIVKECTYPKDEAYSICNLIKVMKKRQYQGRDMQYKDIAVLYRTLSVSKELEQALIANKIPYKIIGGTPFMARKEIKDILAYARIVVNPYDVEAFKRTIAIPKRGIGDKSIEKIDEIALNSPTPLSILKAASTTNLKGKADAALKQYLKLIEELEQEKLVLTTQDFLKHIITKVDYLNYLEDLEPESFDERYANIQKLLDLAEQYPNIEEMLSNSSLNQNPDKEEDEDCVQLLTLHASKGLEWPCVIIAGCIEGLTPHFRSTGSVKEIEEERRLFYVGITRAQDTLFLTTTRKQLLNRVYTNAVESRFIKEMTGFIKRM